MSINDEVCRDFITGSDISEIEAFINTVDPKKFDSFVSGLVVKIHKTIRHIESKADEYYNYTEEALSGAIAFSLEANGYKVKNEAKERGRIDITVEKDEFTWLIEAKIGYNNQKTFEGLLQLTSRYLTSQRSAGFLIYYKKRQPSKAFGLWKQYIENKEWVTYATKHSILDECNEFFGGLSFSDDALCIKDSVKSSCLTSAGSPCQIYTFGVNCFFKPIDTSGRGNNSLKKAHALLDIHHAFHDYVAGEKFDIDGLMDAIDEHFSCTENSL
jgi:hypothetical protein